MTHHFLKNIVDASGPWDQCSDRDCRLNGHHVKRCVESTVGGIMGSIEQCQLDDNVYHAHQRLKDLHDLRLHIRGLSSGDFVRINGTIDRCIAMANEHLCVMRRTE